MSSDPSRRRRSAHAALAAEVLDEAEITRFLDLVQRLPELTAAEIGGLTIVAKPGVMASVKNPSGLF